MIMITKYTSLMRFRHIQFTFYDFHIATVLYFREEEKQQQKLWYNLNLLLQDIPLWSCIPYTNTNNDRRIKTSTEALTMTIIITTTTTTCHHHLSIFVEYYATNKNNLVDNIW